MLYKVVRLLNKIILLLNKQQKNRMAPVYLPIIYAPVYVPIWYCL